MSEDETEVDEGPPVESAKAAGKRPAAAAALQAEKKPRKTYKSGQVVSSTFRMKTEAEVKAGVCQGCFKNSADEAKWTFCADPARSTRRLCAPCESKRDPEVVASRNAARTSRGTTEKSKQSRTRCKCDRLGVPCLHNNGNNKKDDNPKRLCATCRDGECNDAYHQSKDAAHFPKPPPTSAPSAAATTQ